MKWKLYNIKNKIDMDKRICRKNCDIKIKR